MRPVFLFPRTTIIDCGASRTALAVFSGGKSGRLRLEQYATQRHAIESGQDGGWLEKTAEALHVLRTRVKPAGPVTVVLPPHLTLMKMFSTPRVKAAKRDKIIDFESQQSIPYPLTDVVWDRLIAGENGHSFNVLLCAAKRDALDPLCAAIAAANLTPSMLLPSALALSASYRHVQPVQSITTLLITIGARSTTLILMENDGFQARSLSLGGMNVTQHIAEEQSCDFAQAEGLKLDGRHQAEITPAVRLFANRLAQEIARTLVHFRQPGAAESPLQLMLAGGTARLPGLVGLLATQLNAPVSLFDALGEIDIAQEVGEFNRENHQSTLPEMLGAAMLQLRARQATINLLPLHLRHQAGRRRLRPWLAVAAGLALVALIPLIAHQRNALDSAHEQNAALERELVPLRAKAARSLENRQRLVERQRQQEVERKIEDIRTGWLRLLGEIQTRFQKNGEVWLERMQLLAGPGATGPEKGTVVPPLRIAFSGLRRSNTGDSGYRQVQSLLETIATIPLVAAVESERFEPAASGLLRFEFVVVLKPSPAL